MLTRLFFMASLSLVATAGAHESDRAWGVKELKEAAGSATEKFKEDKGEALYEAITGFAADLNAQAIAAKVKIAYKDGGVAKTASYFCHEHEENVIDCH